MSDLPDFVHRLAALFDTSGVPYMLTGSVVSTFYGTPRTTQDVDVVVRINGRQLAGLLGHLDPDEYYVSESAAEEAVRRRGQFNIIDMQTGWKADVIVCKNRDYSRTEFERRTQVYLFGRPVYVASREDAVLSKLEWANKSGGSERQMRDVEGMLTHSVHEVDVEYIKTWSVRLGVASAWNALLLRLKPSE